MTQAPRDCFVPTGSGPSVDATIWRISCRYENSVIKLFWSRIFCQSLVVHSSPRVGLGVDVKVDDVAARNACVRWAELAQVDG